MTSAPITPIQDFSKEDLYEADRLAGGSLADASALTDRQLQMLAEYSQEAAQKAHAKRAKAWEEADRARLLVQARANASASAPTAPRAPASEDIREGDSWDAIVRKRPHEAVPLSALDAFMKVVNEYARAQKTKNLERNARLDELERRCKELEQRPRLKYCGDWSPQTAYIEGDLTTFAGSTWHCEIPGTNVQPSTLGIGATGWKLFCSRGRQGKSGDAS